MGPFLQLPTKEEDADNKQAQWRTDPKRSGIAGAVGDIGSHCENLVSTITGLEIAEICADLTTFVPGRLLDDDANVLLHFSNGARGILTVSQVCVGEENNLGIRIWGTDGAREWHQEHPNYLYYSPTDRPVQVLSRGNDYLCEAADRASRLPTGHPEAFIEAFGNVYLNATDTMRAKMRGVEPTELELDFPTVYDGARGVAFIEHVVESSLSDRKWLPFEFKLDRPKGQMSSI